MVFNHWDKQDDPLVFVQRERNIVFPGRQLKPGGVMVAVVKEGVCMNGDYGTNPNAEEMRELLEVMRECVAEWDRLYGARAE